ncbi:MAG: ankyrin repeat domain-containing protein [Epsilonproteobacteria bacterium]|nr:ankyrin repeat domain-containing protein [Campylobacterota bacterium]
MAINTNEILKTQDIETIKNSAIDFSQINLASILKLLYTEEDTIGTEFLQFLIDAGIEIDKQTEDGNTALMIAVYFGDFDTVKLLVQNKADLNIAAIDEQTALTRSLDYYVENRSFSMTEYLVDNGADINYTDKSGMSILAAVSALLAYTDSDNAKTIAFLKKTDPFYLDNIQYSSKISKQDALELMEYLLKKGANPNTRAKSTDGTMVPLLALMTMMHNVEAIELLLKYGANPNVKINEVPLLFFCFITGNLETLKLLLHYKADVDFTIGEQSPLLFLLISQQLLKMILPDSEQEFIFEDFSKHKFEIAKLLIENGVNPDEILQTAILSYLYDRKMAIADIKNSDFSALDKIKFILLESNSLNPNLKTIEFLLENGANINIEYEESELHPLCQAVRKDNLSLVKLLVRYIDDVNIYINENKTMSLFFNALKYGNYDIVEVLIKNGANINEHNLHITPLFYAIYKNDMKLIQMLVENGANVNQTIDIAEGITISPLMYAVRFNHVDISKFLVEKGANIDDKFTIKIDKYPTFLLSTYEISNQYDDQELADFFELKGADVTLSDERGKKDFDYFEHACKTLDVFSRFFTKKEKPTQLDREKLEGYPEFKEKIINLEQKIDNVRQEIDNVRQKKFDMYQSKVINKKIAEAIESKSMDKLQKLIDEGFDLSDLDINELFINNFPSEFIYEVIKQSQNIDIQTQDGMTPLMYASQANNIDLVKLLLDRGADKNIKNSVGKRAKDLVKDGGLRKFIISHIVPIGSKELSELLITPPSNNLKIS